MRLRPLDYPVGEAVVRFIGGLWPLMLKQPFDVLLGLSGGADGQDARASQVSLDVTGEDHVIAAPVQVAVALSLVPQLLDGQD